LLATGRVKEAVNIFQKTAKFNKIHYAYLKPGDITFKAAKRISVVAGLNEMLKSKKMHFVIFCCLLKNVHSFFYSTCSQQPSRRFRNESIEYNQM
jgi:hypothetical protein